MRTSVADLSTKGLTGLSSWRFCLLVLFLLQALALPARADKLNFVPVWFDKSCDIAPADLDRAVAAIRHRSPHPQHIVVLIHGWQNTREQSARSYRPFADHVVQAFHGLGEDVVVVGVQWPSDVGGKQTYAPQYVAHSLVSVVGLGKVIPDPYGDKLVLARRIGFLGARRFLLALHDRFPQSSVHVFAHSLGAVMIESAVRPRATSFHDGSPRYEEKRPLGLDLVCLGGPDIDADAFYRDPGMADDLDSEPRLTWITIPGIFGEQGGGGLRYHHIARMKAAMGNTPPHLTDHEWATLVRGGRFLYDAQPSPKEHDLPVDFSAVVVRRLAAAAADLRNGTHRSIDMEELRAVVKAPDDLQQLSRFMDSPRLATRLVALWRTETLVEGKATHLESGYLFRFARRCYENPSAAAKQIANCPCRLVSGQRFPTTAQWARVWAHAGLAPRSNDSAAGRSSD